MTDLVILKALYVILIPTKIGRRIQLLICSGFFGRLRQLADPTQNDNVHLCHADPPTGGEASIRSTIHD